MPMYAVHFITSTMVCLSLQSYENGQLTLEKKGEDGKGKCPFDPFQRYASIMLGEKQFQMN